MELRQLRAFVQVVQAGTFTRGAEELHLAQSAVSHAIGRLEAELGATLLRRTSRGVELTEAGAVVLARAREVVAGADAIPADLAALSGLQRGTVVLGTMLPPGPVDLPRLLSGFHDAHSGIVVRVREGSAPEILALLGRDEVDVGVAALVPDRLPDGLAGQLLLREDLVLIAPPQHRLGGSQTVSPADVADEPFIAYRPGSALRDTVDEALRAAAVAPRIVYETDELTSVRELVAGSLGISIVPRSTVDADGPRIAAVPIGLHRPLTLVWRERRQPPAAQAFLSHVRAVADANRLPLAP